MKAFIILVLFFVLVGGFFWGGGNFFGSDGDEDSSASDNNQVATPARPIGGGDTSRLSPQANNVINPTTPPTEPGDRVASPTNTPTSPSTQVGGGTVVLPKIALSPDNPTPTTSNNNRLTFTNREVEIFAGRYEPSPHQGKIQFLERTSSLDETNVAEEYVTLVATGFSNLISITDWQIFSFIDKKAYFFPYGIDLLIPNEAVDIGPIFVRGGDHIIVSTGASPLSVSFRTNKCIGYRQQFKDFHPSLKERCPLADDELNIYGTNISFTDITCLDYIDRVDLCEAPVNIPSGISSACYTFLTDTLTETGCVENHKGDADFYGNELRVFLSSKRELWREEGDAIFLLDENRRLVDVFEY